MTTVILALAASCAILTTAFCQPAAMADDPKHQSRKDFDDSITSDLLRPRARVQQPKIQFERPLRVGFSPFLGASSHRAGGLGWLLLTFIAIPVIGILLWYSSEPVLQLKPNPPAELTAGRLPVPGDQQLWARHYWECARAIRSKYTYGQLLPDAPPPEFRIAEEATVPAQAAAQIRLAYWKQLQRAWLDPEAWETSRRWVSAQTVWNRLGL
jgi:hypothetical protein